MGPMVSTTTPSPVAEACGSVAMPAHAPTFCSAAPLSPGARLPVPVPVPALPNCGPRCLCALTWNLGTVEVNLLLGTPCGFSGLLSVRHLERRLMLPVALLELGMVPALVGLTVWQEGRVFKQEVVTRGRLHTGPTWGSVGDVPVPTLVPLKYVTQCHQ